MADKLRQIFEEAVGLEPAQREGYLAGACADDAALRAMVEGLLRAHDGAAGFLSSPTAGNPPQSAPPLNSVSAAATMLAPQAEGPGTRIGPYKLLQLIGEGGFGSVFMAEQERPVSRRVALKIIKLGMDTRQVVARFEQERQALAMMDHPHIAKVLDAGATETGRPFFVMELVKGDPIVDYCDKNTLSITDRLELFTQVCNAVQHAHTKGIIHRDIKPSNILVSTQDGRPHTKVIDFGIAKATASKLTEKTLFTEHKALIGTPEYMSPEQAEGNLDIDTRTDVYSLGVLLYELLTGTTPFTAKELRSAAFGELQRIIREVEPPKPSTRLSANTDTLASVAAKRGSEPRRLGPIVRGELDWIVMKALEKDRQRRYETANGLAMDVRRYLTGEAVLAAPPSNAYRIKKFVRCHKGPVAAAGLVSAALVLGIIGTGFGLVKAERQTKIATANEAQAKEREAETAAVLSFVEQKILAAARPKGQEGGQGYDVKLADAIAAATPYVESSFADQPLIEARLRMTLGQSYMYLAKADLAEAQFRRAAELYTSKLGRNNMFAAGSLNDLARAYEVQGKYSQAESLFRETVAIHRAVLPAGDTEIAAGLNNLAQILNRQEKFEEVEQLYREALGIWRKALPAEHPSIARGVSNLAAFLWAQHRPAEAEPLFREALAIHRKALPAGHPDLAMSVNNLATFLEDQGKLTEAEPLLREALATFRATLPAGHPSIAIGLDNLAKLLQAQGKLEDAEKLQRDALAIRRGAFPAGHPEIAKGLENLAVALAEQGKADEAEVLIREALGIRRASLPVGHPAIGATLTALAEVMDAGGKQAETEPLYREALEISRASRPVGHPEIARNLNGLAMSLHVQRKFEQAIPLYREALQINRTALPKGHSEITAGLNGLGIALQSLGKLEEVEPLFREAMEINRATLPPGDRNIMVSMNNLAGLYWRQRKLDQSIPLFEESLKMTEAARGRRHPDTLSAIANLAVNYKDAGRFAEAIPILEEAHAASKQYPMLAWVIEPLTDACLAAADPAKPESVARVARLLRQNVEDARRTLPKESPELAGRLAACSTTLLSLHAWDEAEPLVREALRIREAKEPDDWRTFNTKSMLGGVLLGQNKPTEAEPLLLAAYQGLKEREPTIPPQARTRLVEALERLVRLYELKGNATETAAWQSRLEAAKEQMEKANPAGGSGK